MKYLITLPMSRKVFIILCSFFILTQHGTKLIAQTFQQGDVFIGVASGQVQWRSSNGTLIKTLNTGQGGYTTGMAFDKANNLYVTNFSANSISRFSSSGNLIGLFGSGYSTPESIVFDSSGNVYVGNTGNGIRMYNSAGTFLNSPYSGRIDWIDLGADQCTMLFTTEGTFIGRINVCNSTMLSNFTSGLGGSAFALRIRQNGEVLLANGPNIKRLSPTGALLQTYTVNNENSWFALNLNPDGTSFWSANINTGNVYKIDIATGNVLTTFNTGTGASTVFGLTVFGEYTISKCAANTSPAFISSLPCGTTIQATVGSPVTFTIAASDPNSTDTITLSATNLPTGASLNPVLPLKGNPVSSVFSWTPTAADAGSRVINFAASDACVQVNCSYTINVKTVSDTNPPVPTDTSKKTCPKDTIIIANPTTCMAQATWAVPTAMFPDTIKIQSGLHGNNSRLKLMGMYNNHAYYESNDMYMWNNAKTITSNLGGHLVTITSKAENDFIFTNFKHVDNIGAWIGLYNTGTVNNFSWVTNEPLSYTNWIPGEPNNYYGASATGLFEQYVHIQGYDSLNRWNDLGDSTLKFIAEFDSAIVTYRQILGPEYGSSLAPGVYNICYEKTNHATNIKDTCCFNITVVCNTKVNSVTAAKSQIGNADNISIQEFKALAYPNPSNHRFVVQVKSNNENERIGLKVFDQLGRVIETMERIAPNQTLLLGANYKRGIYFIKVKQGGNQATIKIIKK